MRKRRSPAVDSLYLFLLAALIGVTAGLLSVAFANGVNALSRQIMGPGPESLSPTLRILIPTVGGILAGLCIVAIRNQRGPFGPSDVMELVMARKGRIRPLRSLVQILSSAITIATGGSIGKEGANSQFGVTVASMLGRAFHESSRNRTVLLGCGIAAGMASAYKAPIAGALFVMEVVLGNFAMDVFAPIVVASVLSVLVTRAFLGFTPLYVAQDDVALSEWYLILSTILLGALCGIGGIGFRRALDAGRDAFSRTKLPFPIRMGIGGLIVGVIGIWWPEVWGNGQRIINGLSDQTLNDGISGADAFSVLAGLLLMKVAATAITAGSGGLGGVFTPTLVVGAAFGAAFSYVVQAVAPGSGSSTTLAFTLVGMAGVCAATTHAPITSIILVFELTNDYALILPLMLCSIMGSLSARLFDRDSIYTKSLRERGHEFHTGIEELAIHSNYVRDIQRDDHVAVVETTPFDAVLAVFNRTRRAGIYVVDTAGKLMGQVQLHDVKQFINDGTLSTVVIAADLTRPIPLVTTSESLASIIERFDDPDIDELPVVDGTATGLLAGRVTRRDLVTCLSEEVLGRRQLRAKLKAPGDADATFVELPEGCELGALVVPEALIGRSIASLGLDSSFDVNPLICVFVDDVGRERRVRAAPELTLSAGARLIVFGESTAIAACRDAELQDQLAD